MKTTLSIIITLLTSSILFSQSNIQRGFENIKTQLTPQIKSAAKPIKTTPNDKAPGDTLWSEDFTNGLPTGWYVQDNTGNNYDWVINSGPIQNNNLTPAGYTNTNGIISRSSGNYMLLFSDEYNRVQLATTGAADDMDSYFQTSGIQVNNEPALNVSFIQKFYRCCSITPAPISVLSVSTDSTFATNFQEYDIINGVSGCGMVTGDFFQINISQIAANYTGKIWLRFHIKSGTSHYFWMIDDISVEVPPANDISTTAGYYGFTPIGKHGMQYTRIPLAHIQPINFSMIAENIGFQHQTGTNLTVDINDGSSSIFNQSTTDITLDSLIKDTLEMLSAWTPPATIGIPYSVTMNVFSDSVDYTPNNNTYTFPPFEVSQYTYALDDYSATPGNGGAQSDPNGATEHEIGNFFEAVVDDIATGVEFLAGSNSTIETVVDAVLYRYSGGDYIEIARSTPHIITASDTTTPITLHLVDSATSSSPNIQKDSLYFVGIHSVTDAFQIATSGTGPNPNTPTKYYHSVVSFPNRGSATTTYSLTNTPMIRLTTDPVYLTINEKKNKIKFNIFPNPSNGVFNVNFSSNEENNVNLTVKNVIGETVITETVNVSGNTNHQISLADYSKGIYFLTIGNETVKLIVN